MKRNLTTYIASALCLLGSSAHLRAAQQPIAPALQELDLDGDFLFHMNTREIESVVTDFKSNLMAQTPGMPLPVSQGIATANTLLKWSGAFSLNSISSSMKVLNDGLCRSISVLERDPADANLPIWRGFVGAPRKLTGIGFATPQTAYFINNAANAKEGWAVINEALVKVNNPAVNAGFQSSMMQLESLLGTDVAAIAESVGSEYFYSIQFDPTRTVSLPTDGGAITIPEPSLVIGIQTDSDLIRNQLIKLISTSGMPLTEEPVGDDIFLSMAALPLPIPCQPTLVQADGFLLIATTPQAAKAALKCYREKTGLVTGALYKSLVRNPPEQLNGIAFTSPQFMTVYSRVLALSTQNNRDPQARAITELMLKQYDGLYGGGYWTQTPIGIKSVSYGSFGGKSPLAMVGNFYGGLVTAIATPSFTKAKANAERNSCINNRRILDAAKEQWAMEKNAQTGATPPTAEISEYIKGGFDAMLCPQGGTYTIGPIGTAPACSTHGPLK